ncbi:MAG: hypothetical protein EXR99_12280 [Gemmataceae bacterium]|nr:hypothetical protein [Gemmataceae bacterium]
MNRLIGVIPNLFTLGNAICGFSAIVIAAKLDLSNGDSAGQALLLKWSAGMIFLAMVFDVLDGYVARLIKVTSDFGGQLDSLCDAISFGAAPAFLILNFGRDWEHPLVRNAFACVAAFYMACAIVRLAKYNLDIAIPEPGVFKKFKGLPSPGAGGCIASLALVRSLGATEVPGMEMLTARNFVSFWGLGGSFLVALLMVSPFPYGHLTKHILRKKIIVGWAIALPLVAPVLFYYPELIFFTLFWIYALNAPVRQVTYMVFRRRFAEAQPPQLDDFSHR